MSILFLLASLGVCNGFLVAIYLLYTKKGNVSEVYFAMLILALSIRIGKSVFLYFFPETDRLVLQIGLSACIFIGPFFYLYMKSLRKEQSRFIKNDILLLTLLFVCMVIVGLLYPYRSYPEYWNPEIVQGIYCVWGLFAVLGVAELLRLVDVRKKLNLEQRYLLMVGIGFTLITITYQLALHIGFTYIWGAFIFSFFFYFLGFRAISKGKSISPKPNSRKIPYGKKLLDRIDELMTNEKLYTDQDLKLDDLVERLDVSRHTLSLVLNQTYPHGYAQYIRNFRIEEAKKLIMGRPDLSLEGIGYEAGFKSKSVFFESFKKIVGMTPAAYKKHKEEIKEA